MTEVPLCEFNIVKLYKIDSKIDTFSLTDDQWVILRQVLNGHDILRTTGTNKWKFLKALSWTQLIGFGTDAFSGNSRRERKCGEMIW